MSIESKLDDLTASNTKLTDAIIKLTEAWSTLKPSSCSDKKETNVAKKEEEPVIAVTPPIMHAETKIEVSTQMPPAPTFDAVVQPVLQKAPFTNPTELIEFLRKTHAELGPEKGSKIMEVMTSLGCPTVTNITPAVYDQLYTGILGIK